MERNGTTVQRTLLLTATVVAICATVVPVRGQAPAHDKQASQTATDGASKPVADQLVELKIQVAELQAALDANHQRAAEAANADRGMVRPDKMKMTSGMGMRTMRGSGMMGADDSSPEEMNPAPMMPMMPGMERMGKMNRMRPESVLPGIPGASHIYHIGSTGFFLDHPQHITLTREQQATLNRLHEDSLLETATIQRKIDEAEQQLWQLTGSDQPDAAKIEAKLTETEKLRSGQRLVFIRAVGQAAKVLTEDQRKALLGMMDAKPGK